MARSIDFPITGLYSLGFRNGPTIEQDFPIMKPGIYPLTDPDVPAFLQMLADDQEQAIDLWYVEFVVSYARVYKEVEFAPTKPDLTTISSASIVVENNMQAHMVFPEPSTILLFVVMAFMSLFKRR